MPVFRQGKEFLSLVSYHDKKNKSHLWYWRWR